MKKVRVERGQLWKHKRSGQVVIVFQKADGDRWVIVAADKKDRNGTNSHKVVPETLWRKFTLVS